MKSDRRIVGSTRRGRVNNGNGREELGEVKKKTVKII